MTIAQLDHAAVGRPITRAGISLFPIYLPAVGDHDPTATIAAGAHLLRPLHQGHGGPWPQLDAERPAPGHLQFFRQVQV